MEETKLIQQCKKENTLAQRMLYEQYVQRIFLVILRYVSQKETAEELTADAFVKAFDKMKSFEYYGAGSFYAWLKKIAVRTCLSYLRTQKLSISSIDENEQILQQDTTENPALPKMQHDEVMKLIMQLPCGYRTVFNMYAIEGYSHKEISEVLQISEQTSRSQFYKARMALQKLLKEQL